MESTIENGGKDIISDLRNELKDTRIAMELIGTFSMGALMKGIAPAG